MKNDFELIGQLQVEKYKLKKLVKEKFLEEDAIRKAKPCANAKNTGNFFQQNRECLEQNLTIPEFCDRCKDAHGARSAALKALKEQKSVSLRITHACKRVVKNEEN